LAYYPYPQDVQSVSSDAPILSPTKPTGQLIVVHSVAAKPKDYLPGEHLVQPSVGVAEGVLTAIRPAGQIEDEHDDDAPPADQVPDGQGMQPSVLVEAA